MPKISKIPSTSVGCPIPFAPPPTKNWLYPFLHVPPVLPLIFDHILEKITLIPKISPAAHIFRSTIVTYLKKLVGIRFIIRLLCPSIRGTVSSSWPSMENFDVLLWIDWTLYLHELSGIVKLCLTHSWRRSLPYRNQSIDLQGKSMDWFLYDKSIHHERVNTIIL